MNGGSVGPVPLGLAAALAWGAADFTGGIATRRANVFGVVIGGEAVGVALLLALVSWYREPLPPVADLVLAGLAGIGGGFGLILLYRALAGGQMSIAAPVSAVLAAAIPVLVNVLWFGLPDAFVLIGLVLALAAIWLIAGGEGGVSSLRTRFAQIRLPFLAGIVFGLFFVLLHQASQEALLWPIIATRLASMVFLIGFAAITRQEWTPQPALWALIAFNGLLDTSGNGLYVLSGQLGRLDVAAVLSSLYPAATVGLAWLLLKERMTPSQMKGFLLALGAIIMITF